MMETHNTDKLKEVLETIVEQLSAEMLQDTTRIIAFETVSGGTPEQEARYRTEIPACLAWLEARAHEFGFRFRQWDNRVAEIEWPADRPNAKSPIRSVGIASHIDVVTPVGQWKFGPFNGHVDDGIFYGRGIQDDKGPLIQSLYGMLAVKKAGIKLPFDVRIIIGTSEETGDWSDVAHYLEQRGAPDCSFTPDADFPIIIGEKGLVNLRFSASWPKVPANAETGMEFIGLKGGERSNIVPGLAEVRLRFPVDKKHEVMKELVRETTRFTVENRGSNVTLMPNDTDAAPAGYYEALVSFIGKSAHSSTPAQGHNANLDALKFFSDIETMPAPVRAFIQFLAFVGAESDGSTLQIESDHPFVGATTSVLSLLSVGPERGEATLNVRPTMGLPCKRVVELAEAAAAAFGEASGLEIAVSDGGRRVEAIYLDPERPGVSEFLTSLQQAFEAVTGQEGKLTAIGGTTYAKALPNCCAFGPVMLGADEELAHQANERLAVASIKRNALIYGLSIALMARA